MKNKTNKKLLERLLLTYGVRGTIDQIADIIEQYINNKKPLKNRPPFEIIEINDLKNAVTVLRGDLW